MISTFSIPLFFLIYSLPLLKLCCSQWTIDVSNKTSRLEITPIVITKESTNKLLVLLRQIDKLAIFFLHTLSIGWKLTGFFI